MGPLLLLGASAAWPCAGISHGDEFLAESDAAEVLFEPRSDGGEVSVSYAVTYTGDAPDLGWVIPVPGTPTAVQDGDPEIFDDLRSVSQPSIQWPDEGDDGGGGCGCTKGYGVKGGGDRSLGSEQNGLTIVAEGFTGTYDYVAIAGTEVTELEEWFTTNGWSGLASEDLQHYVDQGSTFVALRVVPDDAATPSEGRELPPVTITYGGAEMTFPSVMALHGTVLTQRTTIYVLAESRGVLSSGWTSVDGGTLIGDGGDDPTSLWDAHLAEVGAGQGFVRSYAGAFDGAFLTRFDTVAPREVHDADAVFGVEDSVEGISSTISLGGASATTALFFLPLAGIGAWRRRRAG